MSPAPETQLAEILEILRAMNKRDRQRMWGGVVRGCIGAIPVIFLLWSGWYFVEHGADLLKTIANTAAESAAAYAGGQSQRTLEGVLKTIEMRR